nr:tectonic-1 [Pogona vitticeps]
MEPGDGVRSAAAFFAFFLLLLPPRQVWLLTPEPPSLAWTPSPAPEATSGAGATVPGPEAEKTPGDDSVSTPGPSQGSPGPDGEAPPGGSSASPTGPFGTVAPSPTEGSPSYGPVPTESPGPAQPAAPDGTPRPGPWPEALTDVAKLCVCDLLVDQCDVNCCCDPDCTAADFGLFSTCSVPVVRGDSQLCRQQEALYSIDLEVQPPQRDFQLADKINPSVFCLQTVNHKAALSFQAPEIPTENNFDRLLHEFGGYTFGTENDLALMVEEETQFTADTNKTTGYQYKDPIQTSDGFLRLPAPLFFSQCALSNPAGFLVNQAVKCNTVVKEGECATLPALSMEFYTNSTILAVPNSSQMLNITIQSITVQTPEGLRTRLSHTDGLMLPTSNGRSCRNAVLEARYLLTFTEAGEIIDAVVALVLGTVNVTTVFVQQSFEIRFIQQNTHPVPLSGSPGYVVGRPIRAGFRLAESGVVQSTNGEGQLTIMKSVPAQDCFAVGGIRTPVLFGYDMMSGCQLRITEDADCEILAPALLSMLKGQNFPDCVASFGNSLPQNGPDWVQIHFNVTKPSLCEVPVSFVLEARWTKYGSLVNPQARIVSLTVTVATAALPQIDSGSARTLQVLSSVRFVDVSTPAEPGYKARPTIQAQLPFDFFFPFV